MPNEPEFFFTCEQCGAELEGDYCFDCHVSLQEFEKESQQKSFNSFFSDFQGDSNSDSMNDLPYTY